MKYSNAQRADLGRYMNQIRIDSDKFTWVDNYENTFNKIKDEIIIEIELPFELGYNGKILGFNRQVYITTDKGCYYLPNLNKRINNSFKMYKAFEKLCESKKVKLNHKMKEFNGMTIEQFIKEYKEVL